MNLPNKLTIARLLATPFFVAALSLNFSGNYLLGLTIFLVAMLTDYLDGTLARSRGQVTRLGMLIDPLADKILISSAFICFVSLPEIRLPAWMAIVIVSREFAITGLRLLAAGQGKILPAGRWGKHKTISQVAAVAGTLLYLSLFYDSRADVEQYHWVIMVLAWATVFMTTFSGFYYMVSNYRCLLIEMEREAMPAGAGEEND